eukprot:6275682-Alexandrium_andersonii.AAC.1
MAVFSHRCSLAGAPSFSRKAATVHASPHLFPSSLCVRPPQSADTEFHCPSSHDPCWHRTCVCARPLS